jgi:SAM-dependent methyltransferase
VDAGCSRGQIKTYVGDDPRLRWFGIDWRVDEPELLDLGYEKVYQYDFDRPLPLEDESFDVVVFLHVIEHLPRPAFTLAELARILRPGGIILAGSPIAPVLVARIRQWQHVRDFQKGVRKPGQHIHSFWPGRWRALAASTGLSLELFNGAFFSRWSGSPLENQWWWVRLNQLWGALFPALGAELYLVGRKAAGFHAETEP